jgi:fatty-acyl-CoA synthase
VRVVDMEMNDVPRDGVSTGEVVMRSPWLTEGYLHDPEGSAALWRGGWLHTGDIGAMDADGFLMITDRLKDVVKTGGEWVSSLQLEDMLVAHPNIAEAAVIGVADEVWGERPLAVVVLRDGAVADEAAIVAHVTGYVERGVISKFAVPGRVEFVEAIPRTSVGKLDKKVLRRTFAESTM